MAMQKVLWTSRLKSIATGLDSKKLAEAIKTAAFDKALEAAKANHIEREKYTADYKAAMKKKLEFVTQVLERSSGVTDEKELARLLQAAKLATEEMAKIHTDILEKNEEYGSCFAVDDFRMDLWVNLKNKKDMFASAPLTDVQKHLSTSIRERSDIMAADILLNAEFNRIVEFENRAKVMLAEISTNAATGLKRIKNAVAAKSDFKKEAIALIEDAWKNESDERCARYFVKNIEIKLNNIQQTVEQDVLPAAVRVDRLLLNVGDAEKLRKGLSGVVKTLKLRLDSMVRKYGEHDWNAELFQRIRVAVRLPEERLEALTPQIEHWVPIATSKINELREQLAK